MDNRELFSRFVMIHILRRNIWIRESGDDRIHFGQMPIMESIYEHSGCSQSELASMINVTEASVALSTKRLQKAGLVEKRPDESNLRRKKMYLTEKGRNAYIRERELHDTLDEKTFSGLSEVDRAALSELLDRIVYNLSDGEAVPPYNCLKGGKN